MPGHLRPAKRLLPVCDGEVTEHGFRLRRQNIEQVLFHGHHGASFQQVYVTTKFNPFDALFDPHDPALTNTASTSRFATDKRTHLGGERRASNAGSKVRLGGWVHRTRNLGGIVFLDLRDRAGLVQVSFDPQSTPAGVIGRAAKLGLATANTVGGEVAARPAEMKNAEMETGEIEVRARDFQIVGPAE